MRTELLVDEKTGAVNVVDGEKCQSWVTCYDSVRRGLVMLRFVFSFCLNGVTIHPLTGVQVGYQYTGRRPF